MRRPLMMMRGRGLAGHVLARHHGVSRQGRPLSMSVGPFIAEQTADPGDTPVLVDLGLLADFLVGEGWDASVAIEGDDAGILIEKPSGDEFYSELFLIQCDFSSMLPPLSNDFCDGMKEQGYCIGSDCP